VNRDNFEGSLVLEKLAEMDLVESFFEAIDNDDFSLAKSLMVKAKIDAESIESVLTQMTEADGLRD